MFEVTQKLCSLLNVSAISDKTEGRINDFCMTFTKRWKDCCWHQHYLFKRHRVWLEKERNIQDNSTEPASKGNPNKNLINRLLHASDLLISSFRKTARYMHFLIFVSNPRSNAALRVIWKNFTLHFRFDFFHGNAPLPVLSWLLGHPVHRRSSF